MPVHFWLLFNILLIPFSYYREYYNSHMTAGSLSIHHSHWAMDESQVEVQDRKDHSILEISEMHTHLGLNTAAKQNILCHI